MFWPRMTHLLTAGMYILSLRAKKKDGVIDL